MISVFAVLAILVAWSATSIGNAISQRVPDEVRDSRAWLAWLRDAMVILAIGGAIYGTLPSWAVILGIATLAIIRWRFPARWSFAAASALALGIGVIGTVAPVAIVIGANVIAGALAGKSLMRETIAQPIGAIIVATLLTLTV